MKKILLSGIQPSGALHIGNYFGALKQFVDLQDQYESFVFVANYHALTTIQDKAVLEKNTLDVVLDYLAVGLDPEKTTLFLQSDVPEVTELTWIFNTLVTVPYLSRAHSYKDKTAKGIEATMGLFDYPVLMAADILLPGADVVPVGQDQKQHVEYARDIALKFNSTFGETFKLPEPLIMESVAVVPGTDGQKMSKSYNNTIPLFATRQEIEKAVMSIPTDSQPVAAKKDPEKDLVFQFHKLFAGEKLAEIERGYREGGLGYADSKKMLVEEIDAFIGPLREMRTEIARDEKRVRDILREGGRKARARAQEKLYEIRQKVGIL
ncbi:MAG: tryptophan--tRNA ligase [Candidatus Campbellbacteria bacterium]